MNKSVKSYIYKGNVFNFIVLTFTSLFQTAALIMISLMLEKIMAIATAKDLDALIEQGVIFLILFVSSVLVYFLITYLKPKYQKRAIVQYKNNIYGHILDKNIASFNKQTTSTYISALTNDVKKVEEDYLFSAFDLITNITLFLCTIIVMLIYSPLLTISGIVLSLLPFIGAIVVGGKLSSQEKEISDQNASFLHFIKDNLIGFSTIKVFKSEQKIKELFNKNNDVLESKKANKTKTLSLMDLVQTVLSLISQFGVFFIGAYISITTNDIEPSVILLFVQLMNYIISPLMNIPSSLSKRLACKPIFKKISEIIKKEDNTNQGKLIESIDEITVSNLKFMYDDKIVLNDISYRFNKNKSYAIVGTSGSGKTTLINLLLGKYDNYSGNIFYNNIEVKDILIDSLFERSSFVEQNVFVFDDSIINNITMYSNIDEELLNEAITKSGLDTLIKEKGRNYRCGEKGCNLSGGEKQRISIARALVKKSQLLLLDEATSALDNETSSSITNNILAIDNITKIMITHRLDKEILTKFDEIIVMKNGSIVEFGSYDELMNNNAIFKSLVELD
ncbi:MAG: ABC transporter ATP-binding protein [Bacilli bacterium]|nr:ABC transporter ATP-binding protein [Bacilli bacterium]MBQ9731451.1 ABC transporter ATP-binding protein [Bacilli bacterium]